MRWYYNKFEFLSGSNTRYRFGQEWYNAAPAFTPYYADALYYPLSRPFLYQIFPDFMRPLDPQPEPQPLPYRAIPARPTPRVPQARQAGQPRAPQFQRGRIEPVRQSSYSVSPNGRINRNVRWVNRLDTMTPRGRRKERKTRVQNAYKWAVWLYDGAGEVADVLDAFHDALPKGWQVSGNRFQMAEAIYSGYHTINIDKLIENLVTNHILDAIIGRANKLGAQPIRGPGRPVANVGPAL